MQTQKLFTGTFQTKINQTVYEAVWHNGNCEYVEQISPPPKFANNILEDWEAEVFTENEAREKICEWIDELESIEIAAIEEQKYNAE